MQLCLSNVHVAPAVRRHITDLDSGETRVGLTIRREVVVVLRAKHRGLLALVLEVLMLRLVLNPTRWLAFLSADFIDEDCVLLS